MRCMSNRMFLPSLKSPTNTRHFSYLSHALPVFTLNFLGTGGSLATARRAPSCLFLDLGPESLIFDCGEGSIRQSVLAKSFFDLNIRIFITHMHLDHCIGLPGIITSLAKPGDTRPIHIYGPSGLHNFLVSILHFTSSSTPRPLIIHELTLDDATGSTFSYKKPWSKYVHRSSPMLSQSVSHEVIYAKDNIWHCCDSPSYTVKAALLHHSVPCFGYVFEERSVGGSLDVEKCNRDGIPPKYLKAIKSGKDVTLGSTVFLHQNYCGPPTRGRKLCILGDTCDSSNIVELGKNSDVLVHESSYSEDRKDNAALRRHSTAKMAASTAVKMNAKKLVLSHVGAQYVPGSRDDESSSESLLSEALQTFKREKDIMVAHDFAQIVVPIGGF